MMSGKVTLEWADGFADPPEGWDEPRKQHGNRGLGGWKCSCGRWAKHLRHWYAYNGVANAFNYSVKCARCGVVTVREQ